MKKTLNMSEFERNNRIGMICHTVVVSLMELLAFLGFITGKYSAIYFLLTFVVGFFSPVAEMICWKRNHETRMIKHFLGYGFAVYFTLVIFTSTDAMLFYFVVPLLLVISIYNDVAYSLKINIGVVTESLLITILGGMYGRFGFTTFNNALIQDMVIILIAVFSYHVAKTININNQIKLDKIRDIMDSTDRGILSINDDLTTLLKSADSTKSAMDQVSEGTNNTAEAVQNQLLRTNEIGEKTIIVEEAANKINQAMIHTVTCVKQGKEDLDRLISEVASTVASSEKMTQLLADLQENMSEMHKISNMIESIAFQTNILALNANVEAAHAGDAGRGFAVVADEVSAMSAKTKDSTEEIGQMISNISASLEDVTRGIHTISEEIDAEKSSAEKSQLSFAEIEKNADYVNENMHTLVESLQDLTRANHDIMGSIETISAVSEEVSALATEARNQEFQNTKVLNHIAGAASQLTK